MMGVCEADTATETVGASCSVALFKQLVLDFILSFNLDSKCTKRSLDHFCLGV